MEKLKEFIEIHYENAIKLKEKFKKTEKKEWTPLIVACELSVQYGHLMNILHKDEFLEEKNRNIVDINDEISDILLQLTYLSYLEKINFKDLNNYKLEDINIEYVSILLGQLIETLMEKEDYRFKKYRYGFSNNDLFIQDRIIRIFIIVFNFTKKNNVDIIKSFNLMLDDANKFLNNYV